MSERHILAADVGGTKTLLALACVSDVSEGQPKIEQQAYFENQAYDNFDALLQAFCSQTTCPPLTAVCLAIAGPVEGPSARLTNLAWQIEANRVSSLLPAQPEVMLINDFSAIAYAIPALQEKACLVLQAGNPRPAAPVLVVGAGTGLGVCYRVSDAQGTRVFPTEGGHLGFAPVTPEQGELLAYWQARLPRVSNENLLSGAGIERIFAYLASLSSASAELDGAVRQEGAAAVSRFARERKDALAIHTMELFFEIYGAVAGDMALAMLAHGGVFLAGGIAAKNSDLLQASRFMQAFVSKSPHEAIMREIPVTLITDQHAGLLGALAVAAELARQT